MPSTLRSVLGLSKAATRADHNVIIFFYSVGVRLLIPAPMTDQLASLAEKNVRLLACRTSVKECGIESEGDLVEGAEMSSLSALVELIEHSDRAVFL